VAWAVRYPRFGFAHSAHVEAGLIDAAAPLSASVHPVQLYAAAAGLGLFLVVSRFWEAQRTRTGATFAFYWLLYGAVRFCIEFLRGDSSLHGVLRLTMAQYICIILVIVSAVGLAWRLWAGGPAGEIDRAGRSHAPDAERSE
jgi:prolipoprotein diacylglyceryltransferase